MKFGTKMPTKGFDIYWPLGGKKWVEHRPFLRNCCSWN